jgi:asparagine synthase (glutamine-hydrolysing)
LTQCSCFAYVRERERLEGVVRRAERLERRRESVDAFQEGSGWCVSLSLGVNEGVPLVHGIRLGAVEGEFSALEVIEGRAVAVRGPFGTRPLYVGDDGSVATDHRLLEGRMWMLRPGTAYDVETGGVTAGGEEGQSAALMSFEEAAERLAALLRKAVGERVKGRRRVAVAFSGGLDSSTLAVVASSFSETVLCSVFADGSADGGRVERAAGRLGLELEKVRVGREDAAAEASCASLPFEPTQMDRALWTVYSLASRRARNAGADLILLGQMADELFGGYAKYEKEVNAGRGERAVDMMRRDVEALGLRGFVRDEMACSAWVEPSFPFADREIGKLGLSLPVEFKIAGGVRKRVLREAARIIGVPEEMAGAPKKAAQYSSGVLKLVG